MKPYHFLERVLYASCIFVSTLHAGPGAFSSTTVKMGMCRANLVRCTANLARHWAYIGFVSWAASICHRMKRAAIRKSAVVFIFYCSFFFFCGVSLFFHFGELHRKWAPFFLHLAHATSFPLWYMAGGISCVHGSLQPPFEGFIVYTCNDVREYNIHMSILYRGDK